MTEKEKMLKGELYNANYDKELIKERQNIKDLCFKYNMVNPLNFEKRIKIIKKIIGKIKGDFFIEQPFTCDYGYNIEIGNNFYANHNLVILDTAKILIGDNVFIGPNCGIYAAGHPIDYKERNIGIEYAKTIKIGNNVWIGGNVCILPGVTIGEDVVIGAGSVVNKDIPSHSVAVGNPCRVLKR